MKKSVKRKYEKKAYKYIKKKMKYYLKMIDGISIEDFSKLDKEIISDMISLSKIAYMMGICSSKDMHDITMKYICSIFTMH